VVVVVVVMMMIMITTTATTIIVSHFISLSNLTELIGIEPKLYGKLYSDLKTLGYRTISPYLFVLSVCLFSQFSFILLGVQNITDMCRHHMLYKVGYVRN
jgi:hypothetical protein